MVGMSANAVAREAPEALPRVCFIHIPKTAGMTVREFFLGLYGELAFHGYTTEDYQIAEDAVLARYRFFAGHAYHRDWSRLPPDTVRFTILRDPVAHAVSLYRYWNDIDISHLMDRPGYEAVVEAVGIARSEPLEAFVTSDSPFIVEQLRGAYARQLLCEATLADWTRASEEEPAIFSEALDRLFGIDAVLTTERLHASFPRLLRRLGLSGFGSHLGRINVAKTIAATDERRLRNILARISPIDFHLYAVAQQIEARYL